MTTRLILGTTNGVPVGTPDEDIEYIYQHSYKPYLRALYKAEGIQFTLHYSGHLLNWLKRHHSEYTDVLHEMVERRQIELLGGAFYDAILAQIPRPDRIGQVESMTTLLRKRFRRRPRGAWLAESIWEQSLPGTLRSCGMDYVFLDDQQFIGAGVPAESTRRPCLTEDQGKTLVIFPTCSELLALARSGKPADVIAYMRRHSSGDSSCLFTLVEEGERFRDGPGKARTGEMKIAWFEEFLGLLADEKRIDVSLPHQYLREFQPRDRRYFPSGGEFREYLATSPESNLMYSKMQYIHVLVNQIRGDKYRRQTAREELWKGQSHVAYWNGREAGIYRNRLRKEVYRSLIEAEKVTRERGIFSPSVVTVDFDMDGLDEYLYQGQAINAYIHPEGGQLIELDYLPVPWNYLDTLSRRPEKYHTASVARRGYDREMRKAFMDRFLDPALSVEQFLVCDYEDLGGLTTARYEQSEFRREGKRLGLHAAAAVRGVPIEIDKKYSFRRAAIEVDYTIRNCGQAVLSAVFAPEINLAFVSEKADSLRLFAEDSQSRRREFSPRVEVQHAVKSVRMEDLVNDLTLTLHTAGCDELWSMPIETVSARQSGTEISYQGSCFVPRWLLELAPGDTASVSVSLSIE